MRTPLKKCFRDVLYRDTSRKKSKQVFIDMRRLGKDKKKKSKCLSFQDSSI
jgi:hypothetical protein